MPLQVNAHLTRVQAAADAGEAYDGPPGPGVEKWAGTADAYVVEKRRFVRTPEGSDVVLDRLLLVDAGAPDVQYVVGDVVSFTRLGTGDSEVADVAIVQRPEIVDPDIPADLITIRLTLAP